MLDPVATYGSARVPRYTSYPTAPHFHAGVDAATLAGWLAALDSAAPLSLYVHVPFCARLCWYCGCSTTVCNDPARIDAYAKLLEAEVATVAAALPGTMTVSHLHFGGGTPTQLGGALASVMAALRRRFRFAAGAEIAIEIDPAALTREMAATLGRQGITRASLGVQDFTPRVQAAVNRVQPFAMVAEAVGWLRDAGIGGISFDLMVGLPHQTEADVARSVALAASLAPDRVAVFAYAHVPWLRKHQRLIDESALAGAAGRAAQAACAAEKLLAHGYRRIGMDHFARPDDALAGEGLKRSFQGYTDDDATALLGFGASAISTLPQGYAQNATAVGDYRQRIAAGGLATVRGIALDDRDRAARAIIERLMCDFAADIDGICETHGVGHGQALADPALLAALTRDGLVETTGTSVRITAAGRPFVRTIASCFDAYLKRDGARHAQAV